MQDRLIESRNVVGGANDSERVNDGQKEEKDGKKRTENALDLAARSSIVTDGDNEGRLDALDCSTESERESVGGKEGLVGKQGGKSSKGMGCTCSDDCVGTCSTSEDDVRLEVSLSGRDSRGRGSRGGEG